MTAETKTIKVAPGSEIDRVLDAVHAGPVILDRGGARYRVTKEPAEDIFAGYDPEAARRALDETAGSWSDLDADQLIEDVYRWRREGSRPPDRLKWPSS